MVRCPFRLFVCLFDAQLWLSIGQRLLLLALKPKATYTISRKKKKQQRLWIYFDLFYSAPPGAIHVCVRPSRWHSYHTFFHLCAFLSFSLVCLIDSETLLDVHLHVRLCWFFLFFLSRDSFEEKRRTLRWCSQTNISNCFHSDFWIGLEIFSTAHSCLERKDSTPSALHINLLWWRGSILNVLLIVFFFFFILLYPLEWFRRSKCTSSSRHILVLYFVTFFWVALFFLSHFYIYIYILLL